MIHQRFVVPYCSLLCTIFVTDLHRAPHRAHHRSRFKQVVSCPPLSSLESQTLGIPVGTQIVSIVLVTNDFDLA